MPILKALHEQCQWEPLRPT